jgi:hypothetical protein
LEINNKRNYADTWRLNNAVLKYQWVFEEIREKTKKFVQSNENRKQNLLGPLG